MQKILVIESESIFSHQLNQQIANLGVEIVVVNSIDQGCLEIEENLFQVVIIAIEDLAKFDFIEYLNQESYNTKTFLLLNSCEQFDTIRAFELGVDDCATKDTTIKEIILRTTRLLKFSKMQIDHSIKIKELELFPETGILLIGDKKQLIRRREAQILSCLIRYKNNVVTRNTLIKYVWGSTSIPTHTTVDVYIRRLRLLLPNPKMIATVRGYGYMIRD